MCGAVSFALATTSVGSITLCIFGSRGSAVSTMWIRPETQAGNDQIAPRAAFAVATAAGVPAEVVQLVADVRHLAAGGSPASRSSTPDRRRWWPGSRACGRRCRRRWRRRRRASPGATCGPSPGRQRCASPHRVPGPYESGPPSNIGPAAAATEARYSRRCMIVPPGKTLKQPGTGQTTRSLVILGRYRWSDTHAIPRG